MKKYPYNLQFVQNAAFGIEPVTVSNIPDHYYLALGITNSCNFDCPFCYYHGDGLPVALEELSIEKTQQIFKMLPMLAGVIFGLEGEPLLHSKFLELMKLADDNANGITLITNGSLLTEKLCDRMKAYAIDKIILSIDGTDTDTYARFRKNGNFSKFKRNASMVAKRFPCQLHATIFRENLSSILNLPALAHELGIMRISLQQVRLRSGSRINDISSASTDELYDWLAIILENARKLGIAVELDRNFGGSDFTSALREMQSPDIRMSLTPIKSGHCDHADRLACILSDGSLFPCAGDFGPVSMREYSFDAIFNHPYLQALRALHKAGKMIEPCRICMNDLFVD